MKDGPIFSRHLVDPQLFLALEGLPAFDVTAAFLAERRADGPDMRFQVLEEVSGVVCSRTHVPGGQGSPDIPVIVYQPAEKRALCPAFLHIHGGAYILGGPEMSHLRNASLARDFQCVIASVEYRLAPETVFPGQIKDCYAALQWLHENAASIGVDPARIAVGGESAGGGLAASLALMARDRGEIPLIGQMLIYPMIDDRSGNTNPVSPYAGEYVWTAGSNKFGWASLLGHAPGGPAVSPYAAAARADDLARLPPAWLFVGALDLFLDEDLDYARRLIGAGVPTELHVYPGAFHGFDRAPDADVSRRYEQDFRNAFGRMMQGWRAHAP